MTSAVERHARVAAGFDARLADALAWLRRAAGHGPGNVVFTTSLGAEDMVLTDLIVRHALPIAQATLDTGKLHAHTLALIERVEAHYGIAIERWRPLDEPVAHFVAAHGEMAMRKSVDLRKACCALRKVEPLQRALAGRSAWVTGLRREQSGTRAELSAVGSDDAGRAKFSPLVAWSWADVWHYIALHEVPYNPLHDDFYPSIGCEPCTRAIALGEDLRAGRWWWENDDARECGLHVGRPAGAVSTRVGEARA